MSPTCHATHARTGFVCLKWTGHIGPHRSIFGAHEWRDTDPTDQAQDAAVTWMTRAKEQEARAVKAEQERDDLRVQIEADSDVSHLLRVDRDEWRRKAENPRPLTADDITDQVVGAVRDHLGSRGRGWVPGHYMRDALVAAFTPPPSRPEGAEAMDNDMRSANAAAIGGALDPQARQALADHLAAMGYRKTGGDQ